MTRIPRLLAMCLAFLVLVSPCRAQVNEAIELVPADSLGFLMVKNLRTFSDKIEKTANKLGIKEHISFLELIKKEMGIGKGINDNGSAVFIVLKGKANAEIPDVIVALPIADRQQIAGELGLKELGEEVAEGQVGIPSGLLGGVGAVSGNEKTTKYPVYVARRGNFVLMSERQGLFTQHNLKELLTAVMASRKSLAAEVQPARQWLEQQDLVGICTDKGISHGLGLFMGGGGGEVAQDTKGQAGQIKAAFADIEKNMKFVAIGGKIDDTLSWILSTAVHFQPDGEYARWIAKAEPADLGLLRMFPDESKYGVAVARISSQMSLAGVAQWLPGQIPAEKRDALGKLMNKLVQQVSDIGLCAYVGTDKEMAKKLGGPGFPTVAAILTDDRFVNPAVIARVRDSRAFLDSAIDLAKHADEAKLIAGDNARISIRDDEMAGKPSRTIVLESKDQKGKSSSAGIVLTALDKRTIFGCLLVPNGVERMIQKHLKPADRSLATNAALKTARALLPEKLQVAVFVDLQTFGFLKSKWKEAASAKRSPPLAFSMRVMPAAVEAQFVIPFDAMKAAFDDATTRVDKAAGRTQATNNMKQLGLAMYNYHDAYGKFPAPAICDKSGKPLLSWRVAMLPFVEQDALHRQFKLDEPWDSDHNKKLLARMPNVYRKPDRSDPDRTHLRVPVGKGAIFSSPSEKISVAQITDGTSNTIMIVETAESVPWTKPEEFDFGPGQLPKLFIRDGAFFVTFADASVRPVSETVREAALRAAFTRAGGEKNELTNVH